VRAVTKEVSRLRTEAHVTHAGNRIVTAEGRIVGPDGKVYAMGTTSCLVLKMEQ
jgi:acyl-coenzyme A thioesterase PaaI-like protein